MLGHPVRIPQNTWLYFNWKKKKKEKKKKWAKMGENGACTCHSCVPIGWWSHRFVLRVSGCCCCNQRNSNEKAPTEHTRNLQNALRAFETREQLFCFGFFWSPVLKSQAGPTLVRYTRESQRVLSVCQASYQPRALVAITVLLMGWSTFWKRGRKIPRAAKYWVWNAISLTAFVLVLCVFCYWFCLPCFVFSGP